MLRFVFAFFLLAVAFTQASAQNPLCYDYTYNAQNKLTRERVATIKGTVYNFHSYDASGRETETRQVDSASGKTALLSLTTYYDRPNAYDKKTVAIFYSAEKPDTSVSYQKLNAQGRVIIDSIAGRGPISTTVFTYNDTLLVREVTYEADTRNELYKAEYRYNEKHQLISKTYTHWKGYSVIEYSYDKKGRLIAEKRKRTLEFSETENLGTVAEYTYSKSGQLISKSESGKANDTLQMPTTTTYSYDQNGRLLSRCAVYSGG